ncbi:MAG: hypothetical protein U0271_03735 [Polyangiaceae bacterium]
MSQLRRSTVLLFWAFTVLPATAAAQAPDAQACIDLHSGGQLDRDEGRLLDARAKFIKCAASTCPSLIRQDCAPWLSQLEEAIPTITLRASVDGADVTDVTVTLDGAALTQRLDGKPISLDPGEHVLKFEYGDFPPIEQRILVRQGERERAVDATFTTPKKETTPPPPEVQYTEEPGPVHPVAYVFGGLAVTGLGLFIGFGVKGLVDRNDLEDSCSPFCTDDDVAPARTSFIVADVGWVTALAGTAALITTIVLRPTVRKPVEKASITSVWAGPTSYSGWVVGVGGTF